MLCAGKWPVGVCGTSWGRTPLNVVVEMLGALDVDGVQLPLGPALDDTPAAREYLEFAKAAPWKVFSTVIGFWWEDYSSRKALATTAGLLPDEHWEEALSNFRRYAKMTAELKSPYVLFHAGFLDRSVPGRPEKMEYRLRTFADIAGENGIGILLETGQESAEDLRSYIERIDHPALFVNLDPANLLSYHKDEPLHAIEVLSPWIRSIHVKDTLPAADAALGGREQLWGNGVVNSFRFLKALDDAGFAGTMSIEREAGKTPFRDIARTLRRLAAY